MHLKEDPIQKDLHLQFASVGVLRVAAWPVETLDPFGSRELFDRATSLRFNDKEELAAFEALYESVIAKERDALWARTASDPRFMKALALANPSLMRKVAEFTQRHGGSERPRNKRARHLETTLYRLLARAVGRTEPFGAWCGVSLVDASSDSPHSDQPTSLRKIAPKRFVTPNLDFFVAVLRALSEQGEVRRTASYRLNPTLGRQEDGSWAYWAPPPNTARGRGTLDSNPVLDAALMRIGELGCFTVPNLEQALNVPAHALDGFFFEQLLPQGIVVGGLALPVFFTDPWDALRLIENTVLPPSVKKDAWRTLSRELHAICERAAVAYESASAETIAELADRAAACGVAFASELDLHGELPTLELSMDSTSPFALTLAGDFLARLRSAVAVDEADKLSSMRDYNERLRRVQCALLGEEGVPLAGLPESAMADLSGAASWPPVSLEDYFPEWPLRTVLVNLVEDVASTAAASATDSSSLGIAGIMLLDDAAGTTSRFLPCLAREDSQGVAKLVDWLRDAHVTSFKSPRFAVLGETITRAPNAAAQPDLGLPRFSMWSTESAIALTGETRVVGIKERGLVALSIKGELFSLAPMSALSFAHGDPILQLLLMSSLRFPAAARRTADDEQTQPNPRATRSKVQGVDRFIAWCTTHRDVDAKTKTGHIMVRRPGASPVRIPMASPLAVSAVLEGLNEAADDVMLEPIATTPFVCDETGHYVTQLVLPFRRR